ncbi:MAG: thioredoxin family protein [Rhodobacter sp.]|nr:thioredoxin family protein [Rhodobacter sp.]
MNRRDFLTLTAAVTLAPMAARAQFIDYTPDLLEAAMQRGDRIILDFYATWCGTCARQQRVMADLRAANPAYDANLTLIHVDWDTWKDSDIVTWFNIPRRSTILALKGDEELARTVAGTSVAEIQAIFDAALNA